jgi:hypothetical protein
LVGGLFKKVREGGRRKNGVGEGRGGGILLITCLVYVISFFGCECSEEKTHVDKVELLLPSPFFCYVVDVEYAVGWDPEGWGWVEINSIDGS